MGHMTGIASNISGVTLKIDSEYGAEYTQNAKSPAPGYTRYYDATDSSDDFEYVVSNNEVYKLGDYGPDTNMYGMTVKSYPSYARFTGWYSGTSGKKTYPPNDSELTQLLTTSTTLPVSKWASCSYVNPFGDTRTYIAVACFEIITYTVTFKDYDGTVLKSETVRKGEGATPPSAPTRTGYAFSGWSGTYQNVSSDQIVTATYTAKTSALTFNANGGSGTMTTGKVATYGQAMPTGITLPTRSGYTFTGFYDASSGGTKYYNADGTSAQNWDKNTTSGTTLYAQWTANTYTVTFNANGGTVSPATASVTYDAAYGTLPTPTYSGYRFAGWWTATSGGSLVTSSTTVSTAANHTLYALWTEDEILVVLDPQGGSISGNYFVRATVGSGGTYPALPTPTRGADTFLGWYTAKTGGALVTQGSSLVSNDSHTLYAHWSSSAATTHTVSFDANGGTVSEASRSAGEGVAVGATQTLPTPTRTGYTFQGWFAQLKDTSYMGTENISAVAKWQGNPMTITFNVNGGDSLSPSTRTVACGNQYGTLPTPTKSGKVFAGWFTAADNTGTQVTASTVVTASVTIYAHWDDAVVVDLDVITFD